MSDPGSDTFTETTTTSWFTRIKDAFIGIGIGLMLLAIGAIGLFWNEGRAVQTARSLAEGSGLVVTVDAARVDAANEGKLVHVAGPAKTVAPLRDSEFGVVSSGLRMVRTVEMYQWKEEKKTETRKNLGGSEETVTTYSYRREWAPRREDSSRFRQPDGHRNPEMRFQGRDIVAADATLGGFKLDERVLRQISAGDELPLDKSILASLKQRLNEPLEVTERQIYLGFDSATPRVGDLRVSYRLARPEQVSVIGRQAGAGFGEYQTQAGDTLLMASAGNRSSQEMFKAAERENQIITWLVRLFGALGIFIGFSLILRPLVVIGDVVPFIGSIVGAGAGLVALLLTAVVAPIVIALAWFYYRPLIAIGVLAAGALAAFGAKILVSRKIATKTAMPVPAT